MKKLLGIIFLAMLSCNVSIAAINGIDKVRILIESLNDQAKKCGLSETEITTSVKYILQNSKLKIVPYTEYQIPTLYVNVSLGYNESGAFCYSDSTLEVFDYGTYNGRDAFITYYSKSQIASGGSGSAFGNFVIGQIESLSKSFIVSWSEVNQ